MCGRKTNAQPAINRTAQVATTDSSAKGPASVNTSVRRFASARMVRHTPRVTPCASTARPLSLNSTSKTSRSATTIRTAPAAVARAVDTTEAAYAAPVSAWAPLRIRLYRALWIAQLTSNVGTWMQTVAAQWLMGTLSRDPLLVALVQTALTLPIFLVGFPAGALGDIFDRRRLLVASQSFMLAAAALLAALTLSGDTTPWLLLALTFAIGLGQALMGPSWQAIQPQLVGRELIPQAAALGATSMNLARAIGPAGGGARAAGGGGGGGPGRGGWSARPAVSSGGGGGGGRAGRGEPVPKVLGPEHV